MKCLTEKTTGMRFWPKRLARLILRGRLTLRRVTTWTTPEALLSANRGARVASNPRSYRHVVSGGRRDGDGDDVPRGVRVHRRLVHLANRSRGLGRGVVRSRITHVRSRTQRRKVRLETASRAVPAGLPGHSPRFPRARVCFRVARTRGRGTRPFATLARARAPRTRLAFVPRLLRLTPLPRVIHPTGHPGPP